MKNPLIETPRLLASVLEKERELSAFARRLMGWGDGPVYFVGSPVSYPACLTAAAAFESVVGMPAMARLEPGFLAYSLPSLRPRALVFVIPPVAEVEEMLGAVRTLEAKAARIFTLGDGPRNPLASKAEGFVPDSSGAEALPPFSSALARHATLAYLALIVARFLKSPSEERCREEEEFEQLPEATERTLVQWADALPVFGNEVGKASRLVLAGGGRFFPVALETARELEKATGISAFTQDVSWAAPPRLEAEARAIVLSCSRCRVKAQVNRWAVEIGKSSGAVMALTDAADKNLLEKSRLSLLLPSLGESAASVLELAVGGSLVSPIVRAKARTK